MLLFHTSRALLLTVLLALTGCAALGLGEEPDESTTPPVARVQVEFDGLDADQERNVRAHLSLAEEPCDAPEWLIRQRFTTADGDIGRGLRALGYYRPDVAKILERTDGCWSAEFSVSPGPPVTMSAVEVTVEGDASDDPPFQALLQDLPLKTGDVLNHGAYESTKRKLSSLASALGYQDATLSRSELRVDPDAGSATALLTLKSGPRYRLGELTVEVENLEESLVRRIAEYEPGQPYSADRLHEISQALSDSGYFANVDVRPQVDAASDLTIPLTVSAEPRRRHLYTAGVGYATDTGPRVRLGYENRRINRRGHRLLARVQVSPVKSELTTQYRVPLERPRSEWLTFAASGVREDTDSFDTSTLKLSANITKRRGRWLETRFIELSRDDFEIGDTQGQSTFLMPGISYARTRTDGSLRPSRGWRLYGEVRAGAEALISEANVVRGRVSAGWLRGLPWNGRIITRAELGALLTSDFSTLPPSLRFFAGGDNSVRGYAFESLGPEDDSGEVVGGRYLAVASVEYEHPISGPWSAAVFVDSGNAFNNDFENGIRTGIGLGLRWLSPVGPIRVDLAHPLDDDDTVVRLHLRIGPDL